MLESFSIKLGEPSCTRAPNPNNLAARRLCQEIRRVSGRDVGYQKLDT